MTMPVHPVHAGPRMDFPALAASIGTIAVSIVLAVRQATGWWVPAVFLPAELAVYLAFSALVRRRRRGLALLRCLGASRGQVFAGVLAEAAWVGLSGAVLGFGVASLLPGMHGVNVALFALLVGIAGAVIAALVPAVRASRVPPARQPR